VGLEILSQGEPGILSSPSESASDRPWMTQIAPSWPVAILRDD